MILAAKIQLITTSGEGDQTCPQRVRLRNLRTDVEGKTNEEVEQLFAEYVRLGHGECVGL